MVREEAQKELVEYLKKTMSSIYVLVEEDFIHETSLSPLKHEIVRVLPFNFIVHEISDLVGLFFFDIHCRFHFLEVVFLRLDFNVI
jgi:hypothetical protein